MLRRANAGYAGYPLSVEGRHDLSLWSQINRLSLNEGQPEGNQFIYGYEEEFINAVDEDLICPICKLPLRFPTLTSCGHRFCKGCIDELCVRLAFSINTTFNLFL